jgi:hypothetical protein
LHREIRVFAGLVLKDPVIDIVAGTGDGMMSYIWSWPDISLNIMGVVISCIRLLRGWCPGKRRVGRGQHWDSISNSNFGNMAFYRSSHD